MHASWRDHFMLSGSKPQQGPSLLGENRREKREQSKKGGVLGEKGFSCSLSQISLVFVLASFPFRRARFPKKRLIIESTTYSLEQTKEEHGVQYDSNTIPLLERHPGHTYEGTPDMDVDVAVELKKEQLN